MHHEVLNKQIVVIDFETTGSVNGYQVEAWQVGMILFRNGQVDYNFLFNSLLRIGDRPINPNAPGNYHQLRNEISCAPGIEDIWPELKTWWLGRALCAHNISTEKSIIENAVPMHQVGPWLDTLKLSRYVYPQLESHKLEDIIHILNIEEDLEKACPKLEPHDAFYDAVACAILLEHLLHHDKLKDLSFDNLIQLSPTEYYKKFR